MSDARDPNANDAWKWTSDEAKEFEEMRREAAAVGEDTLVEHVAAAAPTLPSTAVEHIASFAIAATFSLQDAENYQQEPFRNIKVVRMSANHAVKFLRKMCTTKTGYPLVIEVDVTGEPNFVIPPFRKTGPGGKGQEGVIDIESDSPDTFKWKEFLARAFGPEQLKEVLAQPVYRVTIENTGVKASRFFISGSAGGCSDAKNWELRFWRQDQKVVRCTTHLDGKPSKYKIQEFQPSVRVGGEGPAQGGQRFVGSAEVRQTGTAFLFGGLEDDEFISYLQRRMQDRDGFNIKVLVLPYEHSLPEPVKLLRLRLEQMLPVDFQDFLPGSSSNFLPQSSLAASSSTQVAPAAGEPTQPALAANVVTQDVPALGAGEPTQPALAANVVTQDVPAIGVLQDVPELVGVAIGEITQNRDSQTARGGWSQQEWADWHQGRNRQYPSRSEAAFAARERRLGIQRSTGSWVENTAANGSQDNRWRSSDRWQGWEGWQDR